MSADDYGTKVTEFLAQRENLTTALEIANHVENVRRLLVLRFWRAVEQKVRGHLARFPSWESEMSSDDDLFRVGGSEPGIFLRPKSLEIDPGYFAFKLGDGWGLFYGIFAAGHSEVTVTNLLKAASELPEYHAVKRDFPDDGWGHQWIIGRYLDELSDRKKLSENENLVRLSDGTALADKAAGCILQLFDARLAAVESLNALLAKPTQQR